MKIPYQNFYSKKNNNWLLKSGKIGKKEEI